MNATFVHGSASLKKSAARLSTCKEVQALIIHTALLGLGCYLEARYTICTDIAKNYKPDAYQVLADRRADLFANWRVEYQRIASQVRRSYTACREARETVPYEDLDRLLQRGEALLRLLFGFKCPKPPEAFTSHDDPDKWTKHVAECAEKLADIDDKEPDYRSVHEELLTLLDRFPTVDEPSNVGPPHTITHTEVSEKTDIDVLEGLMVVYAGVTRDRLFGKAMEALNPDWSVNRKLEELDKVMPIPTSATASQLASIVGKTPTAVKRSAWWKKRMKLRGKYSDEREDFDETRTKDYEGHGSRHNDD